MKSAFRCWSPGQLHRLGADKRAGGDVGHAPCRVAARPGHLLPQIAAVLIVASYRTRRGGAFHPTTVNRLLERAQNIHNM